ncbi:hypothetical protein [Desulfomonile tiedjei]|uniref:Uncharacterized protein n=1 Tax=Desulfomonile tiedjei (strain ATCC 49306 / DSM 6799 / DCB-1) TaxID=706587 RepID=I4CEZ2_DESTA|nr:hypothetical protein [Desulfomonile tiedjei]AFM28133.1 hypothetical protein Desti_5551 [Desulfomonile tiedjei DSM 6799]
MGLDNSDRTHQWPLSPEKIRQALGVPAPRKDGFVEELPFSFNDITAGSENELQVAVTGNRSHVDLPLIIEQSNYFSNILKRTTSGDTSKRVLTDLEKFLDSNTDRTWENSWVRFPKGLLGPFALSVLNFDLLANKKQEDGGLRNDTEKFFFTAEGEEFLRVPISYLLKLSLADIIGSQENLPSLIGNTGRKVMGHLLNDNTSPETHSFHVVTPDATSGMGHALAEETSKRFLLVQALVMYANKAFKLEESGQNAAIYFSPHPPVRQKELNDLISDSFYRELFMSPCLSGWDDGVEKHNYMCLCHQVLSRSQLNAVSKLKDAGIITRNLVVLPSVSNISLANNGTHISIGSPKLSRHLSSGSSEFTAIHEKWIGDLAIKIVEHFLPLFVGTYSAAPYRLGFSDFHPEKVLGFLPHELDYTHLRMLWRRWKKKADLRVLGRISTPFGIPGLDEILSSLFHVRGDFVPDFRLVDYPVSLLSTEKSPALNGILGNEQHLKKDLADLGVFDLKMALYIPYRLREFSRMGFSGFEGRYYSLFASLESDLAQAADLQRLITALAFKYVLQGTYTHRHIPDSPNIESERRQAFFGTAIGIPTFYVHSETTNLFMKKLIERTKGVRYSRRYPGYRRVYIRQFQFALLETLRQDASDLIELMGLEETIRDLEHRIQDPEKASVAGRITQAILDEAGKSSPLSVDPKEFNLSTERYYRGTLRRNHLRVSFKWFEQDCMKMASSVPDDSIQRSLRFVLGSMDTKRFLSLIENRFINETLSIDDLRRLVNLILISVHLDIATSESCTQGTKPHEFLSSPIHRSDYRKSVYRTALMG